MRRFRFSRFPERCLIQQPKIRGRAPEVVLIESYFGESYELRKSYSATLNAECPTSRGFRDVVSFHTPGTSRLAAFKTLESQGYSLCFQYPGFRLVCATATT
jgi:hypothetical protein